MYLSFYHLKHKPFQISTDPRFLWLGEKHEEALATLRYGVLDNKGFLLLTGDVGTGKTTLINALLKSLGDNILAATLRDPDLKPMDFYNYTAHAFGMPGKFSSKGTFLIEFERFLHDADIAEKTVLLIIDEAQRINQKLLEEIRLLSNIEKEDKKLLNIFFVGQIEFNEILLRPENRAIRQRITVNYNIEPLTNKETGEYIQYRLKIAGTEEHIFEEEALNTIFSFSHGYPRLINIICDRSLLTGFVEEAQIITAEHVRECIKELTIPQFITQNTSFPENESTHSSDEQTSISLIRANAKNKIFFPKKQPLSATFIGIMIAASCLFFVFLYNINSIDDHTAVKYVTNIWHHLLDKMSDANKTAVLPKKNPSPDNVQKNTFPSEILKSDNSLPEKNMPVPEDINSMGLNTTKNGNNAVYNEPATNSLLSQDRTRLADNSSNSETQDGEVEENQTISLEPDKKMIIPFPSDSNFPTGQMMDDLDKIVKILSMRPEYSVKVYGYTDSYGNEPYNNKLSEFRAYTVKSYLVGKGLPESRIIAQGFGSQNPIESNETPSGRIANRRVEIVLQK